MHPALAGFVLKKGYELLEDTVADLFEFYPDVTVEELEDEMFLVTEEGHVICKIDFEVDSVLPLEVRLDILDSILD